jgi:hypothetical protein
VSRISAIRARTSSQTTRLKVHWRRRSDSVGDPISSNLMDSQPKAEPKDSGKLRPRGNYWEVTYRDDFPPLPSWRLEKDALATENEKTKVEVNSEKGTRALTLSDKTFETCDFNHFTLQDSTFADCTFRDCRFVKSVFQKVKFSRCHFEVCHFLLVSFQQCQFIDCTFSVISASAEHLVFQETAISGARFIGALVTNLNALPKDVTREHQEYRHLSTKSKIARAVFISVRDEPELDQVFGAHRRFEIARLRKKIADSYWQVEGKKLVKRNAFYRFVVRPVRIVSLWILEIAGFLTNWGRSLIRSVWLLLGAIIVFTGIYHFGFGQELGPAALRALDCTFVFGYTRYAGGMKGAIEYTMFVNAFIGFCWYAVLVPALSKRLFR